MDEEAERLLLAKYQKEEHQINHEYEEDMDNLYESCMDYEMEKLQELEDLEGTRILHVLEGTRIDTAGGEITS